MPGIGRSDFAGIVGLESLRKLDIDFAISAAAAEKRRPATGRGVAQMLARSAYGRGLRAVGRHGPFEKTRAGGGRRIAVASGVEQTPAEVVTAGNALTKIIGSLPALENLSLALAMPIDNQGLESLVKAGPSIENLSLRMLEATIAFWPWPAA